MNTRRRDILIIGAVGIGFIILISIIGAIYINLAPVFTLVLYAGLIVVTMFYAYYSMGIAEATREQADASVKMAERMVKPILIPYLNLIGDFDAERKVRFDAGVDNDGNGPAYDLDFWIEDDSTPASVFRCGKKVAVLRGHQSTPWFVPDPRIPFPHSDRVLRRFS